ncbi:MAG: lytic murein transglycosylase [Thermoleophilaceae bacterium]
MKTRLLYLLLSAGLLVVAGLTAFTYPAAAQDPLCEIVKGVLPPLVPGDCPTPAVPAPPSGKPAPAPAPAPAPSPAPAPAPGRPQPGVAPKPGGGKEQERGGSKKKATPDQKAAEKKRRAKGGGGSTDPGKGDPRADLKGGGPGNGKKGRKKAKATPLRNPDGSPSLGNPGLMDTLPGPSSASGVPNFVIRKFRVPVFLLPIYQAAGIQYGVRWEVLAAINEIETDYGRNLNVSSAGALGWMQFIPSTFRMYGVDANKDGKKDPFNPVDAIFSAARYLKAAGYEKDARRAVFAYNHAGWYVDSVMLRAKLIAGVPADLVGSLTGLTEGRFPVASRARYADDLQEKEATKRVKRGQNAANVVSSDDNRSSIDIFARQGSPVVATNDGEVKEIGQNKKLGRYVVLQDVYGNRYSYSGLGSTAKNYPVPKQDAADTADPKRSAQAVKANADAGAKDPKPTKSASAGRQPGKAAADRPKPKKKAVDTPQPAATVPVKERLFAHPDMPEARDNGGLDQLLDSKAAKGGAFETYKNYFSRPFGANAKNVRLSRLKKGSRVIGGTILGRIGRNEPGKASHLSFAIRPAGKGAPNIDPKPILDGWKLLEATAVYRASGRNVLYGGADSDGLSIGQIILLPKPLLEKRVLSDSRIDIYPSGRDDIRSGQIDRRVLATLAYLSESGLRPTVSSLRGNHGLLTASGNVSEHSSGNAVDISAINGTPIVGHQEPGGITEQTVRRLMRLQGTITPHQIISLLDLGQNTFAMGDHNDHIHVGFQPLFGDNKKLGRQALAVLKPGQWSDLLKQLRKIDNPVVPTSPSKYALPAEGTRASDAHRGE